MLSNRIMSFRSKHYPRNASAFRIRQEFAVRYYAALLFIVMIGVMLRINYGREGVIFGIVGVIISFLIGNVMAKVHLRRNVAEIFFVNDGFSIISIEDILSQNPKRSFPLRFADPTRGPDQIHFNFEDQIITLKREDWGTDFDLIWNWLNQDLREFQSATPRFPEEENNAEANPGPPAEPTED